MPWGSDPVVGAAPSGGGGWGKDPLASAPPKGTVAPAADSGWGSFLTSPQFMQESYGQEAKDIGLSAADYALLGQGKRILPTSIGDQISQAHQNLGYADYGVGGVTYALGPGKFLKPLAEGLGGGIATEGALVGGISGFDPNAPVSSTLGGAAGGAALGYGAGKLGEAAGAVGVAVGKKLGMTAGQVDPAFATQFTKQNRDYAYGQLKNYAMDPNDLLGAHTSATLTPGMAADVTPGMQSMLARQRQAIQQGGNTVNDVDDYVKNLRSASGSPSASNGDKLLAGQTADNLEGLLRTGQPITGQAPGEAMQALTNARGLHQQYAMAQALQDYAGNLQTFGIGPGMDPVKQAQFYNPQTQGDQIKTLAGLFKQGAGSSGGLAYPLTHMAAEGAEGLAAASGMGGPATMGVGALAHLAKVPIKKLLSGYGNVKYGQAIQQAYPMMTGIPQGARGSISPGDAIKALMLSQGSQYGY